MTSIGLNYSRVAGQPLGNILLTDSDGVATYANDGITLRTGFSIAEIIDAKPGRLWGGHMSRRFYQGMWQTLRDKHAGFVGTVTNRSKVGHDYEELLAVTPLESSDGTVQYLALRPPQIEDGPQFVSEWRAVFTHPRVSAGSILPWMQRWFPTEFIGKRETDVGLFSDWISRHWVGTLRDRFRHRIDDRILVAQAKADPQAYRVIYEKYFETIERYFMRHLQGNRDQALDLTQDTFIRAFERLAGYETRNAAYGTYLLRIAHSILLNSYRGKLTLELSSDLRAPDRALATELHWIWESPELSHREQLVLSAYYREGFTVREIGRGLGISENAAKLILSRVRKKLRGLLHSA